MEQFNTGDSMAARKRRSSSKSVNRQSLSRGTNSAIYTLAAPRNTSDAQDLIAHLNASSLQATIGRSNPIAIHDLIPAAESGIETIEDAVSQAGSTVAESSIPSTHSEKPEHSEMPAESGTGVLTDNLGAEAAAGASTAVPAEIKQLRHRRVYVRGRLPGLKQEMSVLRNEQTVIKAMHFDSSEARSDEKSINRRRQYISSRLANLRHERKALAAERKDLAAKFKSADVASYTG
jgi:hypothetical protein